MKENLPGEKESKSDDGRALFAHVNLLEDPIICTTNGAATRFAPVTRVGVCVESKMCGSLDRVQVG